MTKDLTAVGITCGIGSMLVGARAAGFKVLGNVEWRKYYHQTDDLGQNTFRQNFPGALFKYGVEDLDHEEVRRLMGADLALGHPECGNFSRLGGVNKKHKEKLEDASDIPLFVDLVAKFQPRFFVMDDLPKSFGAFPMSEYVGRLPDYDLFPEWVSNWGYGNIQRHRKRMFMLGSRREERWVFEPGETDDPDQTRTLENTISDLPTPRRGSNVPNHDPWAPDERAQKNLSMRYVGDRPTWAEVAAYAKDNWPPGKSMTYFANDGTIKYKPGCKVEHWDHHGASVQDGGSYKLHPLEFRPLTLRERARIQGFPDDFVFYGAKFNAAGGYNYDRNVHMCKQTGKAMPVQFCQFVSEEIAAHIRGTSFHPSGVRILPPNEDVSRAKQHFCESRGYSDQERACSTCWLYSRCTIRSRKYRIGEPARGQRDLIDPGVVPGPDGDHPEREVAVGCPLPTSGRGVVPDQTPRVGRVPAKSKGRRRFADLPRDEEFDLFGE